MFLPSPKSCWRLNLEWWTIFKHVFQSLPNSYLFMFMFRSTPILHHSNIRLHWREVNELCWLILPWFVLCNISSNHYQHKWFRQSSCTDERHLQIYRFTSTLWKIMFNFFGDTVQFSKWCKFPMTHMLAMSFQDTNSNDIVNQRCFVHTKHSMRFHVYGYKRLSYMRKVLDLHSLGFEEGFGRFGRGLVRPVLGLSPSQPYPLNPIIYSPDLLHTLLLVQSESPQCLYPKFGTKPTWQVARNEAE
jgi:hypothetical protein